ncbi:MAG: transposase, partial [Paracoccaceae bacterium]
RFAIACRVIDACLNQHWFTSIGEARQIIENWRIDYNTERPHSSLKYLSPEECAATRPFDKTQWAQTHELSERSAPAPIAHAAE